MSESGLQTLQKRVSVVIEGGSKQSFSSLEKDAALAISKYNGKEE